ncbi:ferrous iron transporter B [Pseudomonas sp. Marseille-QA0892]
MLGSPLELVREGLFETIAHTEDSLERFICDRNDGVPLQQAIDGLQQMRGILELVELPSGCLLVQEMMRMAMGIPAGAGDDRNQQLAALGTGLHILRRYLESVDGRFAAAPELLLPTIDVIRQAAGLTLLPESFFFSVALDQPRVASTTSSLPDDIRPAAAGRLRHMYQVGLLGYCRDDNPEPSLRLMERAMVRLQASFDTEPALRLCWIAAAALEAMRDGDLIVNDKRKRLLGRLDRALRDCIRQSSHEAPASLLKELLYLITLANTDGPKSRELKSVFKLSGLPFGDRELADEYARLAAPGRDVMRSLATALNEELAEIKDLLDLVERGAAGPEGVSDLSHRTSRLAKTLEGAGLPAVASAIESQIEHIAPREGFVMAPTALTDLARALLDVEAQIRWLVTESTSPADVSEPDAVVQSQLAQAKLAVVQEALQGLARTRGAISTFLDTQGDHQHLEGVPESLETVRGAFWFLDEQRAAEMVSTCERFIRTQMVETQTVPAAQTIETLADALTSLEYFLESGSRGGQMRGKVLDLAEESLQALQSEAVAA